MRISQVPLRNFIRELQSPGVWIRTGPFRINLQTSVESVGRAIHLLYADFALDDAPEFADFHIQLTRPRGLRRWYRPQVFFSLDNERPFKPLPLSHAFAMFEWCLNWCIEKYANQYLTIHAAVIERQGCAAIMAAEPGAGKSTLTAALINRGWRLLSDELAVIDPVNGLLLPLARPVGLKNKSIDVIREFVPGAVIGPCVADTIKGTVAHLRPPPDSVNRAGESAVPQWVIFPRFEAGAAVSLEPYPKATSLVRLADHSFNYSQHGVRGFEVIADVIDRSDCYKFTYSKLDEAIAVFDALVPAISLSKVSNQ